MPSLEGVSQRTEQEEIRIWMPVETTSTEEEVRSTLPDAPGRIIDISGILPPDFDYPNTEIRIPFYAFVPDAWSKTFLDGLSKINFRGKTVYEVGAGGGPTEIYLCGRGDKGPRRIIFSDIDRRLTHLANENLQRVLPQSDLKRVRIEPRYGDIDLASAARSDDEIHYIIACIPQVPIPPDLGIDDADHKAHYFVPEIMEHTREKIRNLYGHETVDDDKIDWCLGLCNRLLEQAQGILKKGGKVVLNLSGRPGKEVLERLFKINGFEPEIIHETVVAQHQRTCLSQLAEFEANGHSFEFYADQEFRFQITTQEAEKRRIRKKPVFHKIYVIQGTKN